MRNLQIESNIASICRSASTSIVLISFLFFFKGEHYYHPRTIASKNGQPIIIKRSLVRPEVHYGRVGIIDAMCIHCNKYFESRNIADNYGLVVGPNGETSKASA